MGNSLSIWDKYTNSHYYEPITQISPAMTGVPPATQGATWANQSAKAVAQERHLAVEKIMANAPSMQGASEQALRSGACTKQLLADSLEEDTIFGKFALTPRYVFAREKTAVDRLKEEIYGFCEGALE